MGCISYVNGRYVPHRRALVHVEDRGYQFADGVYEVFAVANGHPVDEAEHLQRLERSLGALQIAWPMAPAALRLVMREVISRNRIDRFGILYLQVTRGVAARNHAFPRTARSSLVVTARRLPPPELAAARLGVRVITVPDQRWKRCDIKSIGLAANVLGKQAALDAGASEAWMVDDAGFVTEGTTSNAWIVTKAGELITRQPDAAILSGITRHAVLALAREHAVRFVERPFSVGEAKAAAEAFLTSTTALVKPVVAIDGTPVGSGGVGPFTERLLDLYLQHLNQAGS
ncbi:MAG: D-amino-acid transaminase [Rhodospirillales bacterium]|nr:D-amino-acid transaminase [Rhodospirillales bacterium]